MTEDDRRFYGKLLLTFGPLFILGGWLAAFTEVGLLLYLSGSVMLAIAPILLRSFKALLAGAGLFVLAWTWPFLIIAS
jgi:hypothetical protein